MKLISPTPPTELRSNFVDSFRDDQRRPFHRLRQKIAKRSIETARQEDALSLLHNHRKGAIDTENAIEVVGDKPAPCLGLVDGPEPLRFRRYQVDDTRYSV
jgi:hypothetical protein